MTADSFWVKELAIRENAEVGSVVFHVMFEERDGFRPAVFFVFASEDFDMYIQTDTLTKTIANLSTKTSSCVFKCSMFSNLSIVVPDWLKSRL